MAEKSRAWTLWSRSGYRGPSELNPEVHDRQAPASPPGADAGRPDLVEATPVADDDAVGVAPARRRDTPVPEPRHTGPLIGQIIDARAVHVDFQPIHETDSGQIVGFEALSRGPDGPLHSPARLFAAARAAGRLGELDWACRAAAFRAMIDARLPSSVSLLVNVEADSLIEPCPPDLLPTVLEAERQLRVFVDLSGRTVSRYPCHALETARRARAAGWGMAINDIEFSPGGLALVPTLEPDVVKLNHSLIASGLTQSSAALVAAIGESERTGAALLLERVENTDAAMVARAAGARYQQGHLLGRPGPLPTGLPQPHAPLPLLYEEVDTTAATPWSLLRDGGAHTTTGVSKSALDHLVLAAASQAGTAGQPPVVAVVTPVGADAAPARQAVFAMLLERCPLIVMLGHNVAGWSDWRVRAVDLPVGHPLADETCFVLLAPGTAMAVAARLQRPVSDVWDLATSQQPALSRAVMRHLLAAVDLLEGGVRSR